MVRRACWFTVSRATERGELFAVLDYGRDVHQQGGGGDAPPYRTADGHQPAACGLAPSTAAHRLLRAHHMDANLPQDFQILDSEDQLRLLKRLIKAMNLDEKQWPPRQAMWYINGQKDEGLRPHHIQSFGNPVEQTGRTSTRPIRKRAIAPVWWISPSCCCAPTSCG